MTQNAFSLALHDWQGFYALLGGSAATLTGLMFIAASLGTRLINDDASAKVRTFVTPTVIYFSLVLLLSALMNIPTQTSDALAAQVLSIGLIGTVYSLSHLPRLRSFHREDSLSIRDWLWNLVLPLFAALWLVASGGGMRKSFGPALEETAAGALLLVMVGLHNAWDTTLYLVRRFSTQE